MSEGQPIQHTFFVAPGPTADELAGLSGQCTSREWDRLVTSREFIEAACSSLEQAAAVATRLLGRAIEIKKDAQS